MSVPEAAQRAAEAAYTEKLVELRLAEGGGFKVASQQRRAIAFALEAAAPHIIGSTVAYLDESVRRISSGPDIKDYELGFDDATRGMAAKVKRLLNGAAK